MRPFIQKQISALSLLLFCHLHNSRSRLIVLLLSLSLNRWGILMTAWLIVQLPLSILLLLLMFVHMRIPFLREWMSRDLPLQRCWRSHGSSISNARTEVKLNQKSISDYMLRRLWASLKIQLNSCAKNKMVDIYMRTQADIY